MDFSAAQTSIKGHVQTALGSNALVLDGAPRSYTPPCAFVWWAGGGTTYGEPLEIRDILHRWRIRVVANAGSDPERQDAAMVMLEALVSEWHKLDAIALGGNAQSAWISEALPWQGEAEDVIYPGVDVTLSVIEKAPEQWGT